MNTLDCFWMCATVDSISIGQKIRVFDTDFCRKAPNDLKQSYREAIITKIIDAVSTGWSKQVHFKVPEISDERTFFTVRGNDATHYVFVQKNAQLGLF